MAELKVRALDPGYTSEVDAIDEPAWCGLLGEFDDANIYQTWAYGTVVHGERSTGRLVLRRDGRVVAIAQARIAKAPLVSIGIAYIRWGPLWRRGPGDRAEEFRQAIRALRNEFTCRRGLVLRVFPLLFDDGSACYESILAEEGFSLSADPGRSRTILMDLRPPMEELRAGLKAHWKRELRVAEKNALEVSEGTDDAMFASLVDIHREMVARKRFVEGNDINDFRRIQARLPEHLKMRIMLCWSGGRLASGLVCSAMGKSALYLFGATSNDGMKSRGSYLLQWRLLERLKGGESTLYDLNGINPMSNPGTYKFKSDLAGGHGRESTFLGRFESLAGPISSSCVRLAETLRTR